MAPDSIAMAIEDAYLAIYGPSGAAVAIAIERNRLNKILVAVLRDLILDWLIEQGGFR